MVKLFIVDDEPTAREMLIEFLVKNYSEEITITGVAGSITEAEAILPEISPDTLLLDIDLPDGTAFDLLNRLGSAIPDNIIFITAFNHFAIQAIKYSALDYILKPWEPDDLHAALKRIVLPGGRNNSARMGIDVLRANGNWEGNNTANLKPEKIALKTSERIYLVSIKDIVHIDSDGNYSRFYFNNSKSILISKSLKEYDELLSESGFARVHQSHLVNIDHIKSFKRHIGGSLLMQNGTEIPVSHRRRDAVASIIKKFIS